MTNTPTHLQTSSLLVTTEAVHAYAELTRDFNPLHVDAAFAASTPMGRQIAHGTMSLCLIWKCIQRNFPAGTLARGDLDVRFVKPVFIGDTVTAGGELDVGTPRQWKVWVRGEDGLDRIAGTFRIKHADMNLTGAQHEAV